MNISTNSECSSGCESGWTMYLDQMSESNYNDPYSRGFVHNYQEKSGPHDHDDEDLSMVSDASSGPPHLHENYASVSEDRNKSKHKISGKTKDNSKKNKHKNLCLDDTASSPILHFSQDNVAPPESHHIPGYSHVFSGAHFEGDSTPRKHFSFLKSPPKGKSSNLLGRKRQ